MFVAHFTWCFFLSDFCPAFTLEELQMEQATIDREIDSLPKYSRFRRESTYDSQLTSIIETGLRRSYRAVRFFEKEGAESRRNPIKAFYLYLGVKKDAQRVILEKIAFSFGIELLGTYDDGEINTRVNKFSEEFETVFNLIHEMAADELEFYLTYAETEKEPKVKSLILMLADLAKEFLFDVKIWYLNHRTTTPLPKPN